MKLPEILIWGTSEDRDWCKWFAWYPVHLEDGRWAWAGTVERRRLRSWHDWSYRLCPVAEPKAHVLNMEPVDGDLLPPLFSHVLIHLGRTDSWVKHKVVGYYVWPDLGGSEHTHRVFVRVMDKDGYLNSRCLNEVRRLDRVWELGL